MFTSTSKEILVFRPAPTTWSLLEYVAHVSEVIPWYVARMQVLLDQDQAQLSGVDWTAAAWDGRYLERDPANVLGGVQRSCMELARFARSLTEEDLDREGIGSDGSARTVQMLLARAGHELAHHDLDQHRGIEMALKALLPQASGPTSI